MRDEVDMHELKKRNDLCCYQLAFIRINVYQIACMEGLVIKQCFYQLKVIRDTSKLNYAKLVETTIIFIQNFESPHAQCYRMVNLRNIFGILNDFKQSYLNNSNPQNHHFGQFLKENGSKIHRICDFGCKKS